jgi:His-Xaa-Ser system protein HxsD
MSNGSEAFLRFGDRICVTLPRAAYSLSAVHNAGYRLARRCTLAVEAVTPDSIGVALLVPVGTTDDVGRDMAAEFYRHLADQQLREKVREETRGVRELILAHAFSRTDLVRRD